MDIETTETIKAIDQRMAYLTDTIEVARINDNFLHIEEYIDELNELRKVREQLINDTL